MFFSMIHILYGFAIFPYRLNTSLFKQNEYIDKIKNAGGIKFDKETKEYIEEVNQIISTYTDNKEKPIIISLYDNAGLVYILDGISPGLNWYCKPKSEKVTETKSYGIKYEKATEYNCYAIKKSNRTHLNKTILLIEKTAIVPEKLIKTFNEKGINFPEGYKIAGKVSIPRVGDTLYVWVPDNKSKDF
jgi:hypothetical protein